ncbi:nuclear mitotic apparatus protein 1-like [Notolabrus celidotus]|uniref:nuclear mitotic apparatus protein 1-like n=1 Tax=Notolabrus celidotus TaxID=1203425 RepID=UPI00148F7710|nr:nuclear mitotic apparatus protein 1-like [Notolabrus celidotus]
MMINLGVKALLAWVKSINQSERDLTVEDLQDGTILLKVVLMLKKESSFTFSSSVEDRLQLIADFIERDCRFSATKGTSVSWNNIRDGENLTIEIAKVLLLLVYHDVMNDRCTLNTLDCDVERELANLTASYVMESEGCVYLSNGLDAYLARKHLPVSREVFERSATTSSSSVSSMLSLSDDESPMFSRKQKITFLDMQTVASSSVSKSPLQEIMNTPKFQLRKVQRQMIKERDYRDGLERELASKLALIAQRESQINQLQYRLDKLKEDQGDQEQSIRDQINELETKNNMLQIRLNEMLKENKDFKSNTSLMERKVDELTEENGVLSSQMRAVCSQLTIFEAEVGRLTETQESAQEEWKSKSGLLESELNQATAQKELLTEQIQILQGKISCLEDEISKATREEVGENMGPVIETAKFETEINSLKNELESTFGFLKKAEEEIQAKAQQLAEYQQEITQQKDLLKQQKSQTEEMIQAKDDILEKVKKEIIEQRAALQEEIQHLKFQLEQAEQQKTEQMTRLQQQIAACEEEVAKLKEIKKEKEDLLQQTEENVKDLENKLSAVSSLLADKEQHIINLSEKVDFLIDETKKNKNEIQAKEEMLAKLILDKTNEQETLQKTIQTLTVKMDGLNSLLIQAEQEIQLKQDQLAKTQQEIIQQREELHQQIFTCEEEVQRLNQEIQVKNEQLVVLKNDSSRQSEFLEQEIIGLKSQLESLNNSLKHAEEQVQAQQLMLTKQEQESAHQKELLQQQLSASEERVEKMKDEVQVKEEQINTVKKQCSEQSEILHQDIQDLKKQVETLSLSLRKAEENLQSKENLFAEQQLRSTQDMEELRMQMAASQDEVKRLETEMRVKEEQFMLQNTESSANSEGLQSEIQTLRDQVKSLNESLKNTNEQLEAKENVLTQKEVEISQEKSKFESMMTTTEDEMRGLREKINAKEDQLVAMKEEGSKHSDMLQQEIQCLEKQLAEMGQSLTKTEEQVQAQLAVISKQEGENANQKKLLSTSEEELRRMKLMIQAKEEEMIHLRTDSSQQKELLHQEIQDLKTQAESLGSSLMETEEKLQSKENLFAEQQLRSTQDMEELRMQMAASQDEVKRLETEIRVKEEQFMLQNTESSANSEGLQSEIQTLRDQVKSLNESLKNTNEQLEAKENVLTQKEVEISQEKSKFESMMTTTEDEMRGLREKINAKEDQLVAMKEEGSKHSDMLQKEIQCLEKQLDEMGQSLTKTEEQVQAQLAVISKQEGENANQKKLLSTSEEELRRMKLMIQAKEEEMIHLKTDSSQQKELLHQEIRDLKTQAESLGSSLTETEEKLQSKENLFAEQQQQNTQDMEALKIQMMSSQDEVKKLKAEILAKQEDLIMLKTDSSSHSGVLQQEIESLNQQMKSVSKSLELAKDQVQAKDDMMAKQEQESTLQIEALKEQSALLEQEVNQLRKETQTKNAEMDSLRIESCKESQDLLNEIQTLRDQVQSLNESLKNTNEQLKAKDNLLTLKVVEFSEEKGKFESMMTTTEDEMRGLREQINAKEGQLFAVKQEGSKHSDMLQQEIQCLKNQLANMDESLSKSEEQVQTQLAVIAKQEEDCTHQKELLLTSEKEVRKIKEEIRTKEDQIIQLKTNSSEQSTSLNQEILSLKTQVETLGSSLRKVEEDVQSKEDLLAQQQQENTQQKQALQSLHEKVKEVEILHEQIKSHEEEIHKLKESQSEKERLLLTAEEELQITQAEFSAVNTLIAVKDQNLSTLREELAAQANLVQKAKEEAEANSTLLSEIKGESSKETNILQCEIQDLKVEVENISLKLQAREQLLAETQHESSQQIDLLQKQLVSVKTESQAAQELQVVAFKETNALVHEKEELMARTLQMENDQKALEKQLEITVFEKERLTRAMQATERENLASRKLESVLQQELELLKTEKDKLLKEKEKADEMEVLKRDLQEQLSAKSEAAEHYKAQMEKAVNFYNGKKQLLQESQDEVAELKNSLEVKECEVKTFTMENKILQLDLEKVQANEKKLSHAVASLEAQLAFADRNLRAQNKIHGNERSVTESMYLEVPSGSLSIQNRAEVKRANSSDSLDQSSLEDSLNTTRKLSAPEESSTPLVRSSERLAGKRRGLQAESLETLYFTPINTRQSNRTGTEHKMELDSSRKNPTSSVKRRRTTQVINITLTKKTPGGSDADETFYSLASTRSQPNLSSANSARPVSTELFDTPARATGSANDQLIGLPGYRRSTIHSQPASTFCVGTENEPDGGPDDWMRIAELQARNKACLPHLKSSYPVESETVFGGGLRFTDEELRMGDPSDTIRRASMMPGQLHESLASHRHSLIVGHSGAAVSTRSHRLSLMPGQLPGHLPSKSVSSSQLRSPKGSKRSASTLSVHQTSPEKKVKASCFPRPLTPKNKNVGPSSSQLHPALSPADRRQSMMFTIDNTPKNSSYLKKGLNKLRSSTRKSPGKSSKKSPTQSSSRKYQENIAPGKAPTTAGRSSRLGSFKSPQVSAKGLRKSPRANSSTGKSPGLSSARKKHVTIDVENLAGSLKRQEDEDDEEEKKKWERPPSSYGSMKSDSDDEEEKEEEEEEYESEYEEEVAIACASSTPSTPSCPAPPPVLYSAERTGFQLNRSDSPETLYTVTTQQTKPPGAVVINTRSSDIEISSEPDDEDNMDEILVNHSPEPPEPLELDDTTQMDENGQPGRLHREQDLSYIFKSIQETLSALTKEELFKFKMWFYQWESSITLQQVMDGDILDFVDKIIEILGMDRSLLHTISTLGNISKKEEAEKLRQKCKRALIRYHLSQYLIRKHRVIREGVVRAGRQNLLDTIYVEPQISTCGYGGVNPSHEIRQSPPSLLQVPSSDTFVGLNNLFRLQKEDGTPVRTVVTTGIPGMGMSVSVGKFSLDWAEQRANKDLQFAIKLSFRNFWLQRDRNPPQSMSIMEMLDYCYPECQDFKLLEEEGCKFLIMMDSFDCYQASLDWEGTPEINDNYTQAHPDVLIVNIIRGTVLRGARVWILGRRAAVSQIPSRFIDVVTEIQGFSEEMKDDYMKKRFSNPVVAEKVMTHYKRLPTLKILAHQPFVCWMLATVFERCFRFQGYGQHPPRMTLFFSSIVIVQINRRLQFYYGKAENELKWTNDDRNLVTKMGKLAFKMLERNTAVFFEEDVKECGLDLTEVTVFSGLCTELFTAASDGRRTFCFIHLSLQEFLAALYVFTVFRTESKNVLESGGLHLAKIFASKDQTKSAAALVHCALTLTLSSQLGQYDMFLRFLCGVLSPSCHDNQLSRYLFHHNTPKLGGQKEVQRLLEEKIQTAGEKYTDRVENLKECLRELSQEDEHFRLYLIGQLKRDRIDKSEAFV